MRKARELGRRSLSLALTPPAMVIPRAGYPRRPHEAVLVLQRGETATTAYYLHPRLEGQAAAFADIDSDPEACGLLDPGDERPLLAVISRYAAEPWLRALESRRARLVRVAFLADDDLPAMMRDAELPAAARGKVAAHYGRHVERLSELASEIWVSTPRLAERYPLAKAAVLPPLPEADPAPPAPEPNRRVVYHGTDVHGRERSFVLEVARLLEALAPDAVVEVTGGADLRRAAAGLGNVEIVDQAPWPEYLRRQRERAAALSLAPLFPSPVNDARAPVKAFDAARLGAAGLFADAPPYRAWVRDGEDGMLLPMDPQAWAQAAAGLLHDPRRRMALTAAAAARLRELRRAPGGLPPAPEA
jgi:hypothetical protein